MKVKVKKYTTINYTKGMFGRAITLPSTHTHIYACIYISTYMHAYIHTHIHTCYIHKQQTNHTNKQTNKQTKKHTHTHIRTLRRSHIHSDTLMQTQTGRRHEPEHQSTSDCFVADLPATGALLLKAGTPMRCCTDGYGNAGKRRKGVLRLGGPRSSLQIDCLP